MDDLTNLENPANRRSDLEERNQPHVTPMPHEAAADDLFDDSVETRDPEQGDQGRQKNPKE